MKTVLIISASDNVKIYEAIIKYFKNRSDISFKFLSTKKNSLIFNVAKKYKNQSYCIDKEEINQHILNRKYDLIVTFDFYFEFLEKVYKNNTILKVHPSVISKYNNEYAIEKTFINHDTLGGMSIYQMIGTAKEKLIYQKKININHKWNLKRLKQEIYSIINFYFPRIIEKYVKINVLILGQSNVEQILAEKFLKSNLLEKLYISDYDGFIFDTLEKISYSNFNDLIYKLKEKNITYVVINSEKYAYLGLVEILRKNNISVLFSEKKFSKIEKSKIYAKNLMHKYNIKSSIFKKISNINNIDKFIYYFKSPVIKIDASTREYGVYFNKEISKIKKELIRFLLGKYDCNVSIIEEKIKGDVVNLVSLYDGENIVHLPLCKKNIEKENEIYASSYSVSCPYEYSIKLKDTFDNYKKVLFDLLKKEKINYPLIISSVLIFTNDNIYFSEFNIGFTSTEAFAMLNYIKNDLLELYFLAINKMLDSVEIKTSIKTILAVVMYAKGYPLKTCEECQISNVFNLENVKLYFHNMKLRDDILYSNGGKILTVVSNDRQSLYNALDDIEFKDKVYSLNV